MRTVIRWLTDDALADAIAGDLAEERARRAARGGSARASVWHAQAMLAIGGHMLRRQMAAAVRAMLGALVPFGRGRGRGGGDVRHALRSLRRAPWYAATVIGVVALSMALATTTFALVDGVLFKPLPFPDAHELYAVSGAFDDDAVVEAPALGVRMISGAELRAWAEAVPDIAMTGITYGSVSFEDGSFANGAYVDRRFFDVFGARLMLGGFTDEDFRFMSADFVSADDIVTPAIITHRLWTERFGREPDVVGRVFQPFGARSVRFQVVGVLEPGFVVPALPGRSRVDVLRPWTPPASGGERMIAAFARVPADRARSAPQALDAAVTNARDAAPPQLANLPEPIRRLRRPFDGADLVPIEELMTASQRPLFGLLFGMAVSLVGLVLLNAGGLAASRAQQRGRDLALRRALGASGWDLFRHALAEHAVLVVAGTLVGLALTPWLLDAVLDRLPQGIALLKAPELDWRVGLFAAGASAVAVLAISLLSVGVRLRESRFVSTITESGAEAPRHTMARRLLVAGQTAVAFALLLGGALLAASLSQAWRIDPGFDVEDTATLVVRFGDYLPRDHTVELASELRGLPGVTGAGAMDAPFLSGANWGSDFRPPAGAVDVATGDGRPMALRVSGGFFQAAGIDLVAGRLPTDAELDTHARVVVVSESVARSYWPSREAVGQTLDGGRETYAVVGVVRDARFLSLDLPPTGEIYTSIMAFDPGLSAVRLFLALDGDPQSSLNAVVAHVSEAHPAWRVADGELVETSLARSIQPRRFSAFVASSFGGVAAVFVVVGMLGLVAMSTSRRTREIGVRMALGSTSARVVSLVFREQLASVVLGLAIGAALAAWAVEFLQSYLFGVTAFDAGVWLAAVALVLASAAAGVLLPAVQASRVDPIAALRTE